MLPMMTLRIQYPITQSSVTQPHHLPDSMRDDPIVRHDLAANVLVNASVNASLNASVTVLKASVNISVTASVNAAVNV